MVRRRKKRSNGRKAFSLNLGDVLSLLTIVGAANQSGAAGGTVVNKLVTGKFGEAVSDIPKHLRANIPQVVMGVGIGVGAKFVRRARLAPRISIPKVISIGV